MPCPPYTAEIPYGDAAEDFAPCAHTSGSFFLDSSLIRHRQGHFSFWGFKPKALLESKEGFVTRNGHTTIASPVEMLREWYEEKIRHLPFDPYFPFCGGLVGFLGYEWGASLENIDAPSSRDDPATPDSRFGFYDTVVGYNHSEKTAWVASLESQEEALHLAGQILRNRKIADAPPHSRTLAPSHPSEFRSSFKRETYLRAVEKILGYLQAGDCYQVNLSQRFMAPAPLSPWEQYLRLRQASPAPYATYLNCGHFQILSSSPECFLLSAFDGTLTTRPIKGTRGRGKTPEEDRRLRAELEQSPKDNAELLMITDLERNDLGKVCEPGSVEVPELRTVESFAQVHHLLSTIRGKRRPDQNIIDCLAALSPGGSITGAPKIRSMQIIEELEPVSRGVYTGSIGWIGPANTAHLNIAIRTLVLKDATAYFHAGGGIVIDSDPEKEYEETLTKGEGIRQALSL